MTEATIEKTGTQMQSTTAGTLIDFGRTLGISDEDVVRAILASSPLQQVRSLAVPKEVAEQLSIDFYHRFASGQIAASADNGTTTALSLSPRTDDNAVPRAEGASTTTDDTFFSSSKTTRQSTLRAAGLPWQLGRADNVRPQKKPGVKVEEQIRGLIEDYLKCIDSKEQFRDRILMEIEQQSEVGRIYTDDIASKEEQKRDGRTYRKRFKQIPGVAAALRNKQSGDTPTFSEVDAEETNIETEALATTAAV